MIRPRILLLCVVMTLAGCENSTDTEIASLPENTADPAPMEKERAVVPYGSWPSPISAASLEEGARGIGGLRRDGDFLYWLESRPQEGGRNTVMRWRAGEQPEELLPAPWNVRTRVQEYGGGALLVAGGTLWFSNFSDQRLYRFEAGGEPVAVTPDAPLRFAGCSLDAQRGRLICIREDHRAIGEPANALVALPLAAEELAEGEVLFSGSDFVSAPRLSPDGSRVAFTTWDHPNMPWDDTTLYSARFADDGALTDLVVHNPASGESVIDPQWRDDNTLLVLSDRDNWWRPYRVEGERFAPIATGLEEMEIGGPAWTIDNRYVYPLPDGAMLVIARRGSVEHLYLVDGEGGHRELDTGAVSYGSLVVQPDAIYFTAGFADRPEALVRADRSGDIREIVRSTRDDALAPGLVPAFEQVTFGLPGGGEAHGVYLPPTNPAVRAPAGTAPPLVVTVHGGPTSVAGVTYAPGLYYWTSRGFAVLNLNYRGSTGFGREYRRALYGNWGVADVEDAVAGARALAEQGRADAARLIIRGGSAGGYTALAVHAFRDSFAAGASYFGVSDIEALARDTHKFESRYLDQLIGPYPERRDLYVARSPIHRLEGFAAPLILLQGLEDPIVPPNQSEMIYEALKARGVPTAYVPFEGESHGFRRAENRIAALEAELFFYSRVLGFETAEDLPVIAIDNLPGVPAPATDGGR